MTPLINMVVRGFSRISRVWDPNLTGYHSPQDFLRQVAEADIYTVDEAEFDTTLARQDQPAHFNTGRSLAMTAPTVWIEYKSYRSPIHMSEGRGAFLARRIYDGAWIRVMAVVWSDHAQILHGHHLFDFPGGLIGQDIDLEGRRYDLRNAFGMSGAEDRAPQAANFFMELLAFVHLPVGLRAVSHQPHAATVRRFRAELGPQTTPRPWTALRYDRSHIMESAA